MIHTITYYPTKPGRAEANAQLVKNVFAAVHKAKLEGVHYAVFQAADGSFFHLIGNDPEGSDCLTDLPEFEAFRTEGVENRATGPIQAKVTLVGNYGLLPE